MKVNGSLVFDASSASEISNLRVQKIAGASVTAYTAADAGRLIFVTSADGIYLANTLYFGHAGSTSWVAIATGGNAAALQIEVDAIETSLGSIVGTDGVFVEGEVTGPAIDAFTGTGTAGAPANVTELFQALSDYASSIDTLAEILDPVLTGNVIYADTDTSWAVAAPGATSGVQAYDAGLTSIAGLTTGADNMVYTTALDTYAVTTLTSFARSVLDDADASTARTTLGLAIGTNVQAYDSDLSDIAALDPSSAVGSIIISDGTNWTVEGPASARTSLGLEIGTDVQAYDADLAQLAGFAPADGDFIVGNGGAEGSRYSLESGATVRTSLGLGDIATLNASEFIRTDGTSAITADIPLGGNLITGLGAGVAAGDAVNKGQLDAAVAGLSWKQSVRVASTGDLTLATGFAAGEVIDGVTLVLGDRILIKDQTASEENGIYVVTAGAPTRATDMDVAAEFDGAAVFVQEGTSQEGQGFTETATVTTVDTDAVVFSQFSGGQAFIGGTGIDITGNTISANLGAGIFELATDNIGIELHDSTTGALILTDDGSTRVATNSSKLHLKTNLSQFDQDASNGLFIIGGGVTEVELAASVAGAGLSGGAGTALAVNVDDSSIEINADTLRVKAAGITMTMLSNGGQYNITSNAGAQTEAVILGENVLYEVGGVGGLSVAVSAGNTITYSTSNASDVAKGVAQFDAADFLVTAGVVTAVAKNIDSLTNVTTTAPASSGEVLSYNGTNWVNKKVYHVDTQASATTWTVTHDLGVMYCNVTIVDASKEVVIPQSITFNSTTQLTVTFNTAIAGTAVVMGLA